MAVPRVLWRWYTQTLLVTTWSPETPLFFGQKAYLACFYPKGCFFWSFALVARIWPYKTRILSKKKWKKSEGNRIWPYDHFFRAKPFDQKKQCFGAPGSYPNKCARLRLLLPFKPTEKKEAIPRNKTMQLTNNIGCQTGRLEKVANPPMVSFRQTRNETECMAESD